VDSHPTGDQPMDRRAEAGYAASWTTEGTSGEKTVTEAEWLNCTHSPTMLAFLDGEASERKLRLFACACCRQFWSRLEDRRTRSAVVDGRRTCAAAAEVRKTGVQS